MMRPKVAVDLNVRIGEGRTFAGFEDIDLNHVVRTRFADGLPPLSVGDEVLAWEPTDNIVADATVVGMDEEKRLVFLAVDWHGFRDLSESEDDQLAAEARTVAR